MMSKRELIQTLQFLAIMPQAYHVRGPEWIMREMEKVAREAVLKADLNARYPRQSKEAIKV